MPVRASGPGADPHQLAAGGQLVEPRRAVGAEPAREHVALPHLRRQRDALQRDERLAQAVRAGAGRAVDVDVLPGGQKARELRLIDRLGLLAQRRDAGPAQPAQDVGVAPLALAATGEQLAAHQLARALELAQRRGQVDPEAPVDLPRRERPVGARVTANERHHRVVDRLEVGLRQAARRRNADRVAVEPGVLGGDPALLAGDPDAHSAALALELAEHRLGREALGRALLELVGGQVAEPAQDLLERVAVAGERVRMQELERALDLLQRLGVDQLAELVGAEQLRQQVAVERQGRRAPLGVGRVALVHVGGDVVEEQRGGERRGGLRLDLDQRDLARVEVAQQLDQRRQVEHVAQALAVGLEDHREAGEVLGDLEQALRLQALLPQRRALARVGARDQQAPGGVLAEAGAEQGRAAELAHDQVLDLVGLEQHQVGVGRLVRVGQVDDDPVVRPDRVGLEVELVADPGREREPPRRVHAPAEGRQHAQAPVADLVAEPLHHQGLVRGHDPGRRLLLAQVGDQVLGRAAVEVVLVRELLGALRDRLAGEGADRPAELRRAPDPVARARRAPRPARPAPG